VEGSTDDRLSTECFLFRFELPYVVRLEVI
jgi:hypothetical protein